MDHSEAINMGAVERYVLGDLSVSEVEEFERHFFDCPQCSEELRALAILQDNARAVFSERSFEPIAAGLPAREPQTKALRASWWNFRIFAPVLAMLAVAAFLGYEASERGFRAAPQSVAEFPLYAAARGEETVVAPSPSAAFYTLYLDKTWDQDSPSYRAAILDEKGTEKFSMDVPAPAPGQAIHILLPAQALPAGRYVLSISPGQSRPELARYPFTLRIQ